MKIPFKNITIFAGYVVNDPELRMLPNSQEATVSLRLVSRYSYRDSAGAWHTQDEFATAVLYRKQAEDFANAGLGKHSFIYVEGRRNTRKWTDGKGHAKTAHEIIVAEWHPVHLPAAAHDAPVDPPAPAVPTAVSRGPGRPRIAKQQPTSAARTENMA